METSYVHSIPHTSHNTRCHHRSSSNNNQTFYKTSRIHATRSQTTIRDDGTSTSGRDATYKDFHRSKTATGWHPLCQPLVWQGTPRLSSSSSSSSSLITTTSNNNNNSLLDYLSPPWKVMLLSDGSVTRHLQLLTDINVTVDCFEQREIGTERTDLPSLARLIPGPSLVQRQVMLHNGDPNTTVPYVYAASWWSADTIDNYIKDKQQPIWVSLSEGRAELYREILGVECGGNEYLEEKFGSKGPFWGRYYVFWHEGKPLTLIYEVFSSALEKYLGCTYKDGCMGVEEKWL